MDLAIPLANVSSRLYLVAGQGAEAAPSTLTLEDNSPKQVHVGKQYRQGEMDLLRSCSKEATRGNGCE